MSVLYLLFFILLWVVTLYFHQKRSKYFGAGSLLILLQLIYAVISLYCFNSFSYFQNTLTLLPFLYLYVAQVIAAMPVLKYNESKVCQIQLPTTWVVNTFAFMFIIATIFQIPTAYESISKGLFLLITSDEGGSDLYEMAHEGSEVIYRFGSLSNPIYVFFKMFSDIGILLFFYFISFYSRRKWIGVLYLVAIIINILLPLSRGARTGTTMTVLTLLISYVTMRRFLPEEQKKLIKSIGIIIFSIIVLLIIALSVSRFSYSNTGVTAGTVGYVGQGNLNFDMYALDANGTREGDRTANRFKHILHYNNTPHDIWEVRNKHSNMKMNDSVFSTFIGDLVLDYGALIAMGLIVVFSFVFQKITRVKNGRLYFHQLIALYFAMCVCVQGGFYLFNYSFGGNLTIIAFIFAYFVFKIDSKYNTNFIMTIANTNKHEGSAAPPLIQAKKD